MAKKVELMNGKITTDKEKRWLKCEFTDAERRAIADDLARAVSDKGTAEKEKKAVDSQFKSRIDACDSTINLKATQLRSGYEHRSVECLIERDFEARTAKVWRKDTDELLEDRELRPDEAQM